MQSEEIEVIKSCYIVLGLYNYLKTMPLADENEFEKDVLDHQAIAKVAINNIILYKGDNASVKGMIDSIFPFTKKLQTFLKY